MPRRYVDRYGDRSTDRFVDRQDAGRALAARLTDADGTRAIVLALPRGGVPVAAVVASALGAPLDVIVVRKVGVPGQSELAMGALASIAGSVVEVRNDSVLRSVGPDALRRFDEVAAVERAELERRQESYRAGLAPLTVRGSDVILVDDGIATGATMRAAIMALATSGPASVTVAVPVAPADTVAELEALVDRVVCVRVPEPFWAVGQAYLDFTQTTDAEVRRLLRA
ncbi:putative phosphoribosyltransferase [Cryobacterium mesophilum]|uniref:Phosphoribosyltransferase n=1 Tax=Terrimesophilobacter mesophilus TaxID=433647 RepID=A0A4R8V992_9MICO|nr:phosphoribosyltransferase family protein [Terrimesophilobacter mesophilus]MBB5632604.1 putative phosphoribosyltransferase [Terrimesophilobacter mesophilus]TFB79419.1 phosphoribosyltransferase [Terrimesophilobacter mesophilus]